MALRSTVIIALRWSAGLRLVSQLLGWLMTLVVIRLLSPEDYGLMSLASVVVAFLTMFNELGVGPALVQRPTLTREIRRQALGITILSNLFFFLFLWILTPTIASFFGEDELVPIIRTLSLQFLLIPFATVPESTLVRNMDFKRKGIIDLVSNLLGGATSLTLAYNGFGVWSLVLGTLLLMFSRAIGTIIAAPFIAFPSFSLAGTRSLLSFGALITVDRLLWFFYSRADVVIIGKILGVELLGIYTVAMQVASLPMQKVNRIFNEVAFPAFAKVQSSNDLVHNYLGKATRLIAFVAFPTFIGISSISPIFVEVVLGAKWQSAVVPLAVLACTMPLRMISNIIASMLQGIGRVGISVGNLIYASMIIPAGIYVGTFWGLYGVCIAWLISFPIVTMIEVSRSQRVAGLGILELGRYLWLPLVGSVIMWFGVSAYIGRLGQPEMTVFNLAIACGTGAVLYLIFVSVFDRKTLGEFFKMLRL